MCATWSFHADRAGHARDRQVSNYASQFSAKLSGILATVQSNVPEYLSLIQMIHVIKLQHLGSADAGSLAEPVAEVV